MHSTDLPLLTERLTELAEALSAKPVSPKGLQVWFTTLREFPMPDVVDLLTGWAKRATKMPAPADIWKALNETRTEKIEAQARADGRKFEAEAKQTIHRDPRMAMALRSLAKKMKDEPVNDPKDWARAIYARFLAGAEPVGYIQLQTACAALDITVRDAYTSREQKRAA